MHHLTWPTALGLVLLCLAEALRAAVTSVTVSPASPIPVGHEFSVTIEHSLPDGNLMNCYSLERRCMGSDPPGAWTNPPDTSASNAFIYAATRTGPRQVRGGAYEEIGLAQYEWSYLTEGVTVSGPDDDSLDAPYDSEYEGSEEFGVMAVIFGFLVYSGEKVIGENVDGYAEQRIRRPAVSYDSGWVSASFSQTSWGLDEGSITFADFVSTNNFDFSEASNNGTFQDFYLQNRMKIYDCTGALQTYTFTERHFQKIKTGDTSWRLALVWD